MDGRYGSGKRARSQRDNDLTERNADRKRRHPGGERDIMPGVDDTVYRILCPGNKIGSVIGKGGGIIKALRNDTRAKIKVGDGIPGVDERVIIIFSASDKDRRKDRDNDNEDDDDDEDYMKPLCPAQDALFRIHERIVEDERGESDDEDEDGKGKQVTARLLVPNNQIGCLLGRGGKVIEKMRSETGAQIKILPKDQLPACAMATDELVQIVGASSVAKKALYEVSVRLHENPPKERFPLNNPVAGFAQNPFVPSAGHLFSSANILPQGFAPVGFSSAALGGYRGETGAPWGVGSAGLPGITGLGGPAQRRDDGSAEEFSFQMLCRNERIGGVIGKGGSTINQIRHETGANIKVVDQESDCDERVILVSSKEYVDDRVSPTLEAVLQLLPRTSDKSKEEGKENIITIRFLVPSNHIGCILGKGGNIISEMRKRTRANIRIMSKDNLPKCATDNDELVQIIGEFEVVREALVQIATRLRANVFKDKDGGASANSVVPGSLSFLNMPGGVPSSGFGGRQDLGSPGGMYSLSGLDLQGGAGGRLSSGGYGSYGSLQTGGASGYGALSGYSTSQASVGGSSFGMVKNASGTSVEVTVPNKAVGSILGRGGSNIAHIREISGAKVKLHDSKPGGTDRIVEISGTPEQTHAAQSLLQAFA
ncbi:hypothetical protein KI387_039269, partial [Taxus chinensis]